MRIWFFTLVASLWAIGFGHADQVDLRKIDRSIRKEPTYQSESPKYCLLVFGPEAQSKAWLVLDGDTLYVDRNCSGDLAEPGKRVAIPPFRKPEAPFLAAQRDVKAGEIRDGRFSHTGLEITEARLDPAYRPKDREEEMALSLGRSNPGGLLYAVSLSIELRSGKGRAQSIASADTLGYLQFADSPRTAPVIHLDGPLTMTLLPCQELMLGDKLNELHCCVGTPGLGKGTFAVLQYVTANPHLIPENRHPVAEVTFPGKEPVTAKVVLEHRC